MSSVKRRLTAAGGASGGGGQAPETAAAVVREYARDTTLHGIRYISRPGAPLWDRLLWSAAVLSCVGFAAWLVLQAWDSFQNSPTLISVESTHYAPYKFPFPAVTICPANRVRRTVGLPLLRRYLEERFSAEDLAELQRRLGNSLDEALLDVMSALSFYQYPFFYRMKQFLVRIEPLLPYLKGLNITDYLLRVLPPCSSIFFECYWQSRRTDCCELFQLQRTESGFCYGFNTLTSISALHCPRGLGLQVGWPSAEQPPGCRVRTNTATGVLGGLELFMAHTPEADELPPGRQRDGKGFRVMVIHTTNVPAGGNDMFVPVQGRDQPPKMFAAKVAPYITTAMDSLLSLAPAERECYFPEEKQLDIFHTYTLQSCLIECRQRYIADKCGCRTFFFDRIRADLPECEMTQLSCIEKMSHHLQYSRPHSRGTDTDTDDQGFLDCSDCLPTCHSTRYMMSFESAYDTNPLIYNSSAYIDFYYRGDGAVKYRMDLAFGSMQLLVSFGGILGLFMGFSLLSLVEFLYYLLRLLLALRRSLQARCSRQLAVNPAAADPAPEQPPPTAGHWGPPVGPPPPRGLHGTAPAAAAPYKTVFI